MFWGRVGRVREVFVLGLEIRIEIRNRERGMWMMFHRMLFSVLEGSLWLYEIRSGTKLYKKMAV